VERGSCEAVMSTRTPSPWHQEQFWFALRRWRRVIPNELPLSPEEVAQRRKRRRPMPSSDEECQEMGLGEDVPCPYVRCRHHLSIEVTPGGALRVFFPHWLPSVPAAVPTCSLAEARKGRHTADEVAAVFGLRERQVLEVERRAFAKIQKALANRVH